MTWGALALVETELPHSRILDNIVEAAFLPALLIAGIFYPEGVHTSRGAPYFGYVLLGFFILFYMLVWFVILSWLNRRRRDLNGKRSDNVTTR
jgi:uncharacterized membrane protein